MRDDDLASDQHLERISAALAGLAPEQSERLVRMVELGAMICLVEEAAAGRGFGGAGLRAPSAAGALPRRERRERRTRSRAHAGAT